MKKTLDEIIMEDQEQESYKALVKDMKPLSYKDVAEDWEKNPKEWYHALIAIVHLPIVLAIPDLQIYAWCRCKLVADDSSEALSMGSFIFQIENWKAGKNNLVVQE